MDFARETVAAGSVEYQLRNPIDGAVVGIFIPEVDISDGYSTLFSDTDTLRDELMLALEGLRFGKNLRFFTDPFDLPVLSRIEDRRKVPTTDAFRTAWGSYLKQKYATLDGVRISWRLDSTERVDSFDALARLLPLSFDGRGVSGFIDPVGTGRVLKCESQPSIFWSDLAAFVDGLSSDVQDRTALAIQRSGMRVPIISVNAVKAAHKGLSGVFVSSGNVIDAAPRLLDQGSSGKHIWNVVDSTLADSQAVQPSNWAAAGASSVFFPEVNMDRVSGGQISPADKTAIVPLPIDLKGKAKQLENGTWWLPDPRPMKVYRYPNGLVSCPRCSILTVCKICVRVGANGSFSIVTGKWPWRRSTKPIMLPRPIPNLTHSASFAVGRETKACTAILVMKRQRDLKKMPAKCAPEPAPIRASRPLKCKCSLGKMPTPTRR
jgi:hypothetical protein